jgi:leucyl-tRNA synthetase
MRSWRSGALVEKKLLHQWFIRTAVFAKDLTDCLDSENLKLGWRDIIDLQKHWIGPIQGYFSDCSVVSEDGAKVPEETLRLWCSSQEVLKNSKFTILQPTHYLANSEDYVLTKFDNGVKQLNFYVRNPLTGLSMPVFTGSTDVPLPLVPESSDCRVGEILSEALFGDLAANEEYLEEVSRVYPKAKVIFVNYFIIFRSVEQRVSKYDFVAFQKLENSSHSQSVSKFKFFPASLKLRDWLVSRQRNWGTPIPAVTCLDCGHSSMVPMSCLPVSNQPAVEYPICHNTRAGQNPNPIKCSNCGSENTKPETDTLDTFFDSSWYFLRYLDPNHTSAIFTPSLVKPWLPVRTYVGGKEHGRAPTSDLKFKLWNLTYLLLVMCYIRANYSYLYFQPRYICIMPDL